MRLFRVIGVALALVVPAIASAAAPAADGASLDTFLKSDSVANSIALTPDGRVFLSLSRIDGSPGPQVVEWTAGREAAFPDGLWNSWDRKSDAAHAFVRVNAVRIGPDGALWIVDGGTPTLGQPNVSGGPKIVRVDLRTNKVDRVYGLGDAIKARSAIDDIRFHDRLAYLTDDGAPGVIVLDLASGLARRILDGDASMTAERPLTDGDRVLRGPDGKPVKINTNQLEVSPDGRFFYYQPTSGPMSRIATRYLDDPKLTNQQLAKHITTFVKTSSTGGTAIDARGNIYCSDIDRHRVLRIDPSGQEETLIEDPRLLWVDGMWIDGDGFLYMPASQFDRMAPFNGGVSKVSYPVSIYKIKIGIKPSPTDHP